MPQTPIPVVSLFCGPGGMDLGFRRVGFVPILAIDDNQSAVDSYNWNHAGQVATKADITELSTAEFVELVKRSSPGVVPRGVIGGPPCQSFSFGNVTKKRRDPRAKLGQEYARVLKALNDAFQLDFFVFENVLGLKARRHKRRLNLIFRSLERAGFTLFEQELDASAFGVPQKRRRLFIIGVNSLKFPDMKLRSPAGTVATPVTVREALGHLPPPTFFRKNLRSRDIPLHPNHWAMNPKSAKFTTGQGFNGRSFKKLLWDKPSWTVAYGNREVHIHPTGTRRLSVFEAMLLQGFPKTYELRGTLSDQITQVSDAVPPLLAAAVAKTIKQTIYQPIDRIRQKLLSWFEEHERPFPWRVTRNPFRILIAEKLLQQTAATKTVISAYNEINRRYPTPKALATARLSELQRIISPLGFHYRASELKRLAKTIVEKHHGAVPSELAALMRLPGVGDYGARAVLAFGCEQQLPVVDTNVARFLHRVFGLRGDFPSNPARSSRLIQLAQSLLPQGRARDFNLAVLDLCASVCTASRPRCHSCPLKAECSFPRLGVRLARATETAPPA